MSKIKSIAVFCGSSMGVSPAYEAAAKALGKLLALHNIRLVYGGAKVGLMGAVADASLTAGGEVIGVIPHFLSGKEIAHGGLSELMLVDTMHERKLRMSELADATISLPGGFGTMEEFFEVLTWAQLGLHTKPVGLLNVLDFYKPLYAFFDQMVKEGFLKPENRHLVLLDDKPEGLLQQFENYVAPEVSKWLKRKEV
jgi:uncharacterized protein (TIGR00730 family)